MAENNTNTNTNLYNIYSESCGEKGGLRFYTCGCLVNEGGFVHVRRTLNCDVFILVQEGELFITKGGREYAVTSGEYILLEAGCDHFGTKASQGALTYMWAHFEGQKLRDRNIPQDGFAYLIPEVGKAPDPQRVSILFRQLLDLQRHGGLYSENFLTCVLSMLLMELTQQTLDEQRNAKEVPARVYNICEWLRSNCQKKLTAETIAERFHYNAEYLSLLFKKETGLTLIQYLNRTRIDVAKRLLETEGISVKETAYSSGFSDEKYFMRMFRKLEGVTPLQYKEAFRKRNINSK